MNEIVLNHPLITHKLGILRDIHTGTKEFRELIVEISTLLCYEATKDAKLEKTIIETPLEKMETGKLNEDNYAIVPILRAGMGMLDGIINVIPNAKEAIEINNVIKYFLKFFPITHLNYLSRIYY